MEKVKLPSVKLTQEEISKRIKEVYPDYPELVASIAKKLANKEYFEVKTLVGHIILTGYTFCKTKDTAREVSLLFIKEKAWDAAKRVTANNGLWAQEIDALQQKTKASISNPHPEIKPESE